MLSIRSLICPPTYLSFARRDDCFGANSICLILAIISKGCWVNFPQLAMTAIAIDLVFSRLRVYVSNGSQIAFSVLG